MAMTAEGMANQIIQETDQCNDPFQANSKFYKGDGHISPFSFAYAVDYLNFPEGAAVSLPLRREGYSIKKCLLYGQASGVVEPIAGVLGALLAIKIQSILPFLLSFSAGAMIGVVGAELIPESTKKSKNIATIGLLLGFMLMMILDVALG